MVHQNDHIRLMGRFRKKKCFSSNKQFLHFSPKKFILLCFKIVWIVWFAVAILKQIIGKYTFFCAFPDWACDMIINARVYLKIVYDCKKYTIFIPVFCLSQCLWLLHGSMYNQYNFIPANNGQWVAPRWYLVNSPNWELQTQNDYLQPVSRLNFCHIHLHFSD